MRGYAVPNGKPSVILPEILTRRRTFYYIFGAWRIKNVKKQSQRERIFAYI
jgi:hypothetical protein